MPLTLEENIIGQLWSFAENSRLNTGGGEGVVIQSNNIFQVPYDEKKNVILKSLPNYVEYKSSSSSSSSSKDDPSDPSTSQNHKSKNSLFKKSSSKDNIKNGIKNEASSNDLVVADLPRTESTPSLKDIQAQITQLGITNILPIDPQTDVSTANSERTKLNVDGTLKNGQYTHKLYFLASKMPWYVRKILPKDATIIHEKSWNMYPIVKTVLKNEYFKNTAHIELDTITRACPTGIPEENIHNLSKEELEKREVIYIDITDPYGEYKPDEDPCLFKSKTGRGPLKKNEWITNRVPGDMPVVCCYKLVHVEFKMFGLQTRVENYARSMYKSLFGLFHRQVFCWMDKWCDFDLAQVRKLEEDLAALLVKKIEQGEKTKLQLSPGETDKDDNKDKN